MFGSLVVVFPTAHEGGTLILRHQGEEWAFDSAAMLAGRANSLAYVAFFSDVEHEVAPVVSGHRVTLTYNLYHGDRRTLAPSARLEVRSPLNAVTYEVKDALDALLRDPTFLPEGGTLGFGLNHSYAFPSTCGDAQWDPFKGLSRWLKGSDAALYQAWTALGLEPKFRLVSEHDIVLDHMVNLVGWGMVDIVEETLIRRHNGVGMKSRMFSGEDGALWRDPDERDEGHRDNDRDDWDSESDDYVVGLGGRPLTVHWVTNPDWKDGPRSDYLYYGNEASLGYFWTTVCILVDVPGFEDGQRTLGKEVSTGEPETMISSVADGKIEEADKEKK